MARPLTHDELRAVYERFGPLVRRRCLAIMRDAMLAEDACQNLFVKLLRDGEGYRAADAKLAWLYRVSDNCCFDLLRSRRASRFLPLDDAPEASADNPEQARVLERRRALAVLSMLDAELQRVAVMHYVDELSQGQIGEALGWSRQTVNAKLAKVRERVLGG